MENYNFIYLIVVAAFIVFIFIYERVTGNSIFGKIDAGRPILEALKLLIKACAGVFPSPYFDKAATILEICIKATVTAEDAWKMGTIPKAERNSYCQLLIARALKDMNIEITPQIQEVINGTVALICMLLPHSALAENKKEEA